jgi:ribonuclease G
MKRLLIEYTKNGVSTAITENGKLREVFINNESTGSKVGQVIVGRIKTIMPGQFAFIDIGSGKNAFANLKEGHGLKAGQPLLVMVQKDSTSSKGAYVSQDISVKGRLLILHKHPPGEVGVSHKITEEKESRRLKKLVRGILPKGYGAVVRTNAEGCGKEILSGEINKLHKTFEEIIKYGQYALPPAKIYPKVSDEIAPVLNDIISENLEEIHISGNVEAFESVKDLICELVPCLKERIFYHNNESEKLFDVFKIKKQIRAALEKIVPLPCGGFVTIEETEACVAIDVNTGNNLNSQNYNETVLQTNLEAAAAIIEQIILRNLSGIIIIDFIDMHTQNDKNVLMAALRHEAKQDRTNPVILELSQLGIVQIARAKRRLSLSQVLEVNCPHCGGKGKINAKKQTSRHENAVCEFTQNSEFI